MHNDTVRVLNKQKQLIEIEMYQYKSLRESGKRGIHDHSYYVKLAHAWGYINNAIKLLSSTEEDVFNNFNYLEQ